MKIFVINLKSRTDRRSNMENQLRREKLAYEIVEATEPSDIPRGEIHDVYSRGSMYQPNEIACSASHRSIYARMMRENIEKAMIFEDNVVIPVNFSKVFEALDKRKYNDIDWLQIDYPSSGFGFIRQWLKTYGDFFDLKIKYIAKFFIIFPAVVVLALYEQILLWFVANTVQSRVPTVVRFYRDVYSASCYIVTKQAAEKLYKAQTPLTYTADKLPNTLKKDGFVIRICIPRFVYQNNEAFGSNLAPRD
ncbi:MAG: glycosyltransferase family 25 protein [Patescibacteria group bacterium]